MTPENIMRITVQTVAAERQRRNVLQIVLASGTAGLTAPEMSAKLNMPLSTLLTNLRILRDEGHIEPSQPRGGPGNRWGAIGTLAAYEAVHAVRLAKLARKREKRRNYTERRIADAQFVDGFARPSIARIVPANLAEPLRPLGPCSVFALGAAA